MNTLRRNEMLILLQQHGIAARPTRSGAFEAVFLENEEMVSAAHKLLQEAGLTVALNFTYGLPMFINLSRRIS